MPKTPDHTSLPDETLLVRFQQSGDKEWLGILLPRYTLLLFGVAMKYLKDKDAAQDAVQQIFLKALTQLPTETIQNFKGWLYIVMRNHCLQNLRGNKHNLSGDALATVAFDEQSLHDVQSKEYTLEQMEMALEELNDAQAKAIRLFYLEQRSYQQIMETTGWTFMQVKSNIQNGKRNLKISLSARLKNTEK